MNQDQLARAATVARGLAIDAVHACSSGHLGLPLGAAEIGAVLFGNSLSYNPTQPRWINRDRFILSAGHGSMFLYSWLHLSGYDLSLEEVKNFRQLHSKTPGHPEFRETPGVEATTGPLGQGVGNAVGYAISGKALAAKFNTAEHTIFDHHVLALAGDGCLQEGVAAEAAALAGHLGLDNLILIYDSNDVTLDAMAKVTQSEDTAKRFEAYGFEVITINGHDFAAIEKTLAHAKSNNNGKPKLIVAKTEIGRGIPEVAGTAKAHGEGGAKFADAARQGLGLPAEHFYVGPEVREAFAAHQQELQQQYDKWQATFAAWSQANPELAAQLQAGQAHTVPNDLADRIPEFAADYADATRSAGGVVIQSLAKELPMLLTGSADLFGSTKNYIKDGGDYSRENPQGRNFWFGIREHAMGAVLNGIAYDGFFFASGATFAVFADYLRPSIRLAALANLPVVYIFTHDSVGVGEDGPTHQPVETCSGLRVIPNLDVIRPGDPEETAGAFAAAVSRIDGPTVLLLSRQKVATLNAVPVKTRREGALRGGYIAVQETSTLERILIGTGSELGLAVEAAKQLGSGTRVVSMPCCERFDRQSAEYRESVLPAACQNRTAIEAGVTGLWWKYVGCQGKVVGIDRFGISAPGDTVMRELGISVENLVSVAR
ncbi:MAG: transketolase [Planctomycetales bacterium]|nr:transketolase [Planctomycetales bacterium]